MKVCPTEAHVQHRRYDRQGGFTLVELVITIAIVIILSVISVPIYRGYVDKAKFAEGYALLGTILSAQKAYYSEYGNFLRKQDSCVSDWTSYEAILGVDARGNKYFTCFMINPGGSENVKIYCEPKAKKPEELLYSGIYDSLFLQYNVTKGAKFMDGTWDSSYIVNN